MNSTVEQTSAAAIAAHGPDAFWAGNAPLVAAKPSVPGDAGASGEARAEPTDDRAVGRSRWSGFVPTAVRLRSPVQTN